MQKNCFTILQCVFSPFLVLCALLLCTHDTPLWYLRGDISFALHRQSVRGAVWASLFYDKQVSAADWPDLLHFAIHLCVTLLFRHCMFYVLCIQFQLLVCFFPSVRSPSLSLLRFCKLWLEKYISQRKNFKPFSHVTRSPTTVSWDV